MARQKILAIEDDEAILELIKYNLAKQGFDVTCATSGEEGLNAARRGAFDLVLLDLLLPNMSGFEVCRALRIDPRTLGIAIVILSAKSEDKDIVTGLECGADGYVTKPFSPAVLVSRIKAVLRRCAARMSAEEEVVEHERLLLDPKRHQAFVDGSPVPLTFTQFEVLHLLARRPARVFSREEIVAYVQGDEAVVGGRSVDVHIAGLRRHLGRAACLIESVRGIGYRMKENCPDPCR